MSALAIVALSVGYALVAVVTACRIASVLAWDWHLQKQARFGDNPYMRAEKPDGDQWFGAGCLGIVAASIWPLTGTAYVARGRLFAPPAEVTAKRQRERIAELERELEIGVGS